MITDNFIFVAFADDYAGHSSLRRLNFLSRSAGVFVVPGGFASRKRWSCPHSRDLRRGGAVPKSPNKPMTAAASPAAAPSRDWLAPTPKNLTLIGVLVFLVSLAALAPGISGPSH